MQRADDEEVEEEHVRRICGTAVGGACAAFEAKEDTVNAPTPVSLKFVMEAAIATSAGAMPPAVVRRERRRFVMVLRGSLKNKICLWLWLRGPQRYFRGFCTSSCSCFSHQCQGGQGATRLKNDRHPAISTNPPTLPRRTSCSSASASTDTNRLSSLPSLLSLAVDRLRPVESLRFQNQHNRAKLSWAIFEFSSANTYCTFCRAKENQLG